MELKLFYVGEADNMNGQQATDALEFITGLEYGVIATNNPETGARLSALNNMPGQTLKALYYGTDLNSQKVANIQADPRCEMMYTNGAGSQIMLTGKAEILTDIETKKAFWQEWMNEFDPEGPEGTTMCIVRFTPEKIRAMLS